MMGSHRKQTNTWYDGNQEHEWCIDCVELWPCEAIQEIWESE